MATPQQLRELLDVARQLSKPADVSSLLGAIVHAARRVLGVDRGTVYLFDPAANVLRSKIATGDLTIELPIGKGIAGACAATREPINIDDCHADPRFNPEIDRQTGYRTRAMLSLPLIGLEGELVGVIQLINPSAGRFDEGLVHLSGDLAGLAAATLQRSILQQDRDRKLAMERELQIARQIQFDLVPHELPAVGRATLAGFLRPADETGGDLYDAFAIDEHRLGVFLADAQGHEITAALMVTQARSMLRVLLSAGLDCGAALAAVNRQLTRDMRVAKLLTALAGTLDTRTGELHYFAAGHGPMLLQRASSGTVEELPSTNLPLGVIDTLPDDAGHRVTLESGDTFAVLSDGFFEHPLAGEEHATTEMLCAMFARYAREPLGLIAGSIADELARAGGKQVDDMSGLIIRIE